MSKEKIFSAEIEKALEVIERSEIKHNPFGGATTEQIQKALKLLEEEGH